MNNVKPMPKSTPIVSSLLVLVLMAAACSPGDRQSSGPGSQSAEANNTSLKEAPNFNVTTIDGDTVSLSRSMSENKPMVVYFTASWCPVCAKNWPVFSEIYPEYKDKLNFVAISIDSTDTEKVMRELAEEKEFTFPVTAGRPQIMLDFGVRSQATTVGINREGRIAFRKNNTALSAGTYRSLFDELVD